MVTKDDEEYRMNCSPLRPQRLALHPRIGAFRQENYETELGIHSRAERGQMLELKDSLT